MTDQELFTTVATHLLTQNEKSLSTDGLCVYRGPRGLKCAFGAVIPDKLYNIGMENKCIPEIMKIEPKLGALFTDNQLDLLESLRNIHDDYSVEFWYANLEDLAKNNGFVMPS